MPTTAGSELVTFREGFVADMAVVSRLIDIAGRGVTFRLEEGGHFRVVPPDLLTHEDVQFLRAHRVEARRVLEEDERLRQQ